MFGTFANDAGAAMRRAASKTRGAEWRVKSRRVLDALIEACGGSVEGGLVVATPGKVVRIDYLRRAIDELTRDESSSECFFHRGVPVNVEAWLRALCEHDVATYVPTKWTRKKTRRQREVDDVFPVSDRDGPVVSNKTLKIRNDVFACETFVESLVDATRERGVLMRRAGDEERADVAFVSTGRAIEGLVSSSITVESSPTTVQTRADSRRLTLLDLEELSGLFSRGGRVVVGGARAEWWVGFAVEKNGDVVRTYDAREDGGGKLPFCPGDAVCLSRTSAAHAEVDAASSEPTVGDEVVVAPEGAWTVIATGFVDDIRSSLRVRVLDGFSVDLVVHAETTRDAKRSASLARRVAELVVDGDGARNSDVEAQRASPERAISRSRSDIARLLSMVVKREHEPWVSDALREPTNDARGRRGDVSEDAAKNDDTPIASSAPTMAPTLCRNAWVLSDGRTVEVRDKTLTRAILGRRRWNVGKRCTGCQRYRHPDALVAGRTPCSSASCERAFRQYSTTTHWNFETGRRKKIELDMNAPLFTDESLALLRSENKKRRVDATFVA